MNRGMWLSAFRGRNLWITLGVLGGLALLALLGRLDRGPRERPGLARAVAVAGDSVMTVGRLRDWLAAQPDSLDRAEVRRWLEGWVEDQILAQAALKAGLDTLPGVREELGRLRLRYLRGLLEEQSLAESLAVSDLEMRTWAKANPDLLALTERQLRLAWVEGHDSLTLVGLLPKLKRGPLDEEALHAAELGAGVTGFVTTAELPLAHAAVLADLRPGEVSKVLRGAGSWLVYRLVEARPVGWLPDPDRQPELVREAMERDLRWRRLQTRLEALRQEAVWKVDIDPLLEVEMGIPPER